jgi:hypothetical protein
LTEPGQGFVQDAPISVRDTIASLIAEHHVEPPFVKRKRNRADPDAWHRAARNTGATMSNDPDFLARWSRRKRVAATDKIRQSKQIETSDGVAAETTAAFSCARRKCRPTLRVCLQSNPLVPNPTSAKPGYLTTWCVRRFVARGREILRSATLSVCRRTRGIQHP